MQRFKAEITLDVNGDGTKTVKLGVPFLLGNLRGFITAGRVEFFRIYFTIGRATVVEDVGDGNGGGSGGRSTMLSPPALTNGKFIRANELVTIIVNAGVAYATDVATVMFDWEQVKN